MGGCWRKGVEGEVYVPVVRELVGVAMQSVYIEDQLPEADNEVK